MQFTGKRGKKRLKKKKRGQNGAGTRNAAVNREKRAQQID
jgi:hypothetical protein